MSSEKLIKIAENQRKVYDKGHIDGYGNGVQERDKAMAVLNADLEQILYGANTENKTLEQNIEQVDDDFQAVKDALVEHEVEVADGTKTSEYAAKVSQVYDKGKQDEMDRFWGIITNKGQLLSDMRACFGGAGWTDEIFTPLYDIKPRGKVFYLFSASRMTNIAKTLEDYGTKLDISQATDISHAFSWSYSVRLPFLDCSNVITTSYAFNGCKAQVIDGIKFGEATTFNNTFTACTALEHTIVSGVIAKNGFNVKDSTLLDKESITSIINCLSSTTSGLTVTFSATAVNNAFETIEGASDGSTSEEWLALIATKTNWTISLADA